MTGTVTYGKLSAKIAFTYTAVKLERGALDDLIAEAEKIDTEFLTDISKERLESAIEAAKAANSYSTVEKSSANLQFVMDNLEYLDEAVNPFIHIADPVTQISLEQEILRNFSQFRKQSVIM